MTEGLWKLVGALCLATSIVLALAWCVSACANPALTASDLAEKKCIEDTEGGAGRAALKKAIDDCRALAKEGGTNGN